MVAPVATQRPRLAHAQKHKLAHAQVQGLAPAPRVPKKRAWGLAPVRLAGLALALRPNDDCPL